jgi:hypothetical protein
MGTMLLGSQSLTHARRLEEKARSISVAEDDGMRAFDRPDQTFGFEIKGSIIEAFAPARDPQPRQPSHLNGGIHAAAQSMAGSNGIERDPTTTSRACGGPRLRQ